MTIGNDILPGIITDIESLPSVTLGGVSALNGCIVGEGDSADGIANENEVYTVTRSNAVSTLFGRESPLTQNVTDALSEGALPVYAVQVGTTEVAGEVVDTASGVLGEAPITSDTNDVSFTLDGVEADITITYGDPSTMEPGADEVILNRVTGEYQLDVAPTDGTADYVSLDYEDALDSIQGEDAGDLDIIGTVDSNVDVSDYLEASLNEMESYGQLALGVVGAGPYIDTSNYTSAYDNSRMEVFYPTRNDAQESTVGSLVGKFGSLGINASVMNKRLTSHRRLRTRLTIDDQAELVGENVVPLASETRGALIVDDITSVADDNLDEAEMDTGFNRLVIDRVTNEVKDAEEPFIGRLNSISTRGALQAVISARLSFLVENDAILDYEVSVQERDAMSAFVEVSIDTIKPLRNIYNTISAGQID